MGFGRDVAMMVGVQFASAALSLLLAIAAARLLGPSGKGVFAFLVSAGALGGVLLAVGIGPASSAWLVRDDLDRWLAFELSSGWTAVVFAVSTCGILIVPAPFGFMTVWWLVPIAIATMMWSYFQGWVGQGLGRNKSLAANTLVSLGLQVIGYAFLFWSHRFRVVPVALVWLVSQNVGSAIGWFLTLRGRSVRRRKAFDFRAFGMFGLRAAGVQWLNALNSRADILILSLLSTAASVGYYSMAVTAVQMMTFVPAALGQVLAKPFGTSEADRSFRLVSRALRVGILGSVLTGLVLALSAPILVPLLMGVAYSPVVLMVWIMVPGMVLYSSSATTLSFFWHASRKSSAPAIVTGVSLIIDLTLLVYLGPKYAGLGAAVASSCALSVAGIVNLTLVSRHSEQDIWRLFWPSRHSIGDE